MCHCCLLLVCFVIFAVRIQHLKNQSTVSDFVVSFSTGKTFPTQPGQRFWKPLKPSLGMHPSRVCVCNRFEQVYRFLFRSSLLCLPTILQHICETVSKSWSGAPPSISGIVDTSPQLMSLFSEMPSTCHYIPVSTQIQERQTRVAP